MTAAMGRRDKYGKRMKWSRAEKRMMREWREVCDRLQREAEQQRQIHFPDGPGESSAAGASSHSFNDPRFPPHLQHLSPCILSTSHRGLLRLLWHMSVLPKGGMKT